MDEKLKLYDDIVEKIEPDDLADYWDFQPLDLTPATEHDLAAEGGFDLSDFLMLGEMADTSLYMLWVRDDEPENAPVVLLTAAGEYGVVAENFEQFLSLISYVGGRVIDLLGYNTRSEIIAEMESLRENVDEESRAFSEALLARFGVERADPAGVILVAQLGTELHIPLANDYSDEDYEDSEEE